MEFVLSRLSFVYVSWVLSHIVIGESFSVSIYVFLCWIVAVVCLHRNG